MLGWSLLLLLLLLRLLVLLILASSHKRHGRLLLLMVLMPQRCRRQALRVGGPGLALTPQLDRPRVVVLGSVQTAQPGGSQA